MRLVYLGCFFVFIYFVNKDDYDCGSVDNRRFGDLK